MMVSGKIDVDAGGFRRILMSGLMIEGLTKRIFVSIGFLRLDCLEVS